MKLQRGFGLVIAVVATTLQWNPSAHGAPGSEEQAKLLASDGAPTDRFGDAVAVDGDTVLAGAPQDDDLGGSSGSAYVFTLIGSQWVEQAKLTAGNGAALDRFGIAVALDGDTALVGANQGDGVASDTGAAYVFVRTGTTWAEQAVLTADDGALDDFFGHAVALRGDTAFVGAPRDDDNGSFSGSVYFFTRAGTTWSQQQKLLASNGSIDDAFGTSLSFDGTSLAVGAEQLVQPGQAYVFVSGDATWFEQAALSSSSGIFSDRFGSSVSLSGATLAVAAKGNQDASTYVFQRLGTTWSETQRLLAPGAMPGDTFGSSVALSGDLLAVGAQGDDDLGSSAGAVHVFLRSGATFDEVLELHASDGVAEARFGEAVALQDDRLIVGAQRDSNTNGGQAGAAYVVRLEPVPSFYCTGKTNSLGCVPFLSARGTPSITSTLPFHVTAHDVVPAESGLLLYSQGRANLDFHGGKLCVKSPVVRTAAKAAQNPGGGCSGWTLSRDFNAVVQSGADPTLTVGQRVRAQWRYRDPADPAGFGDGLTNGVQFTLCP